MSVSKKKINEITEKIYGNYPEKILQFGEGNFLRAFVDWMIEKANESKIFEASVVLCQTIENGLADLINEQNGIYTVLMQGLKNGKSVERYEKVTSISRCINPYNDYNQLLKIAESKDLKVIVSNTTEAGIAYCENDKLADCPNTTYPAKLCAFLYHRYLHFKGCDSAGLLILPVELIDNNGAMLKKYVIEYAKNWKLEDEFINWICSNNEFASTLVDRIVTGFPKDRISYIENKVGYIDNLMTACEPFNLWVIQCDKKWYDIFPIDKTIANVIFTDDVTPYKKCKVRILNGSHTAIVPLAFLSGYDVVLDFFVGSVFGTFETDLIYNEIVPTINLDKNELNNFANEVIERFKNPYIKHYLIDITLNSCSKFSAKRL